MGSPGQRLPPESTGDHLGVTTSEGLRGRRLGRGSYRLLSAGALIIADNFDKTLAEDRCTNPIRGERKTTGYEPQGLLVKTSRNQEEVFQRSPSLECCWGLEFTVYDGLRFSMVGYGCEVWDLGSRV